MNDHTEWNRLVAGLLAGTLSADEHEALLAMCRESQEVLEETARVVGTERLLTPALTDPTGELTAREVVMRLSEGTGTTTSESGWRMMSHLSGSPTERHYGKWLACAAALALLAGGGWWMKQRLSPIAVMARSESLIWEDSRSTDNGPVKAGTRLKAAAGLLELRFNHGAKLILEGPFDLELQGEMSVVLHKGRMAATCPRSSKGFTVSTSEGKIVDLGTEFGVDASGQGATEVHVLNGEVQMRATNRTRYSLFEGEALKVDQKNAKLGSADSSAFITVIPQKIATEKQGGYVHWSFDEANGDHGEDTGSFLAMGADASMKLTRDPEGNVFGFSNGPTWKQGMFGSALSFDGQGAYTESGYRGIEGANPRTVALWVRLPKGDTGAGMGVLSWGSATEYGVWQIAVNWSDRDTKGCLRVGTYKGRIVGTTDLCDGEWHHIAVVLGPGPRAGVPGNVFFYVDGKLEPISVREDFRVDTNTRQAETGVILGRHSVPVPGKRNFFKGEMDEVFIFDRPLVQEEIQHLMKHNEVPWQP